MQVEYLDDVKELLTIFSHSRSADPSPWLYLNYSTGLWVDKNHLSQLLYRKTVPLRRQKALCQLRVHIKYAEQSCCLKSGGRLPLEAAPTWQPQLISVPVQQVGGAAGAPAAARGRARHGEDPVGVLADRQRRVADVALRLLALAPEVLLHGALLGLELSRNYFLTRKLWLFPLRWISRACMWKITVVKFNSRVGQVPNFCEF